MPLDLSLPFQPRNPLPINSAFGVRPLYGDMHSGVDFNSYTNAPANANIRAAGSGVVIESYNGNVPGQSTWAKLRGTMVVIDHGIQNGIRWVTRYHMLVPNSNIARGSIVARGTVIGKVGVSGSSATGPHLHFELWRNGVPVDPMKHLSYVGLPSSSNSPAGVGGSTPIDNSTSGSSDTTETPIVKDSDLMIRIQSPARGIALVGAGYYRQLTTDEEVQQSGPLITGHFSGNDRQFDVWVSMAVSGSGASSPVTMTTTDKAILDAVNKAVEQTKPPVVVRTANSKATLLPADGSPVTLTKHQDDADTNSLLREVASRPAGEVSTPEIDIEALAAAIADRLPKSDAATKTDLVDALNGLSLDISLTGKAS